MKTNESKSANTFEYDKDQTKHATAELIETARFGLSSMLKEKYDFQLTKYEIANFEAAIEDLKNAIILITSK